MREDRRTDPANPPQPRLTAACPWVSRDPGALLSALVPAVWEADTLEGSPATSECVNELSSRKQTLGDSIHILLYLYTHKTFPSSGIYLCSWSPLTHFTSLQYEGTMGDREEKWSEKTSPSLYGFIIFFHAFLAMFSHLFYSLQTTYIIFLSQCINQQSQHWKFTKGKIKPAPKLLRTVRNLSWFPPIIPGLSGSDSIKFVNDEKKMEINITVTYNISYLS